MSTNRLFCGIDVAKHFHEATVIDANGNVLCNGFKFSNTTSGKEQLDSKIKSLAGNNGTEIIFGLEATGHYGLNLYSNLIAQGQKVYVYNPYAVSLYRRSKLRKTKNDRIDSYIIAELIQKGEQPETGLSQSQGELKELSRFRINMVDEISDRKRQILCILDKVFPEYDKVIKSTLGNCSLKLLKEYSTPEEIAQLSLNKLAKLLQKYSKGRYGRKEAAGLKSAASNSFGSTIGLDSSKLHIKMLIEQIEFLSYQLKQVDLALADLMSKTNCPLATIPGIGDTLAATIFAEIGDIKRFQGAKKLVAYAGLDPSTYESGQFKATTRHISKQGSKYLRYALCTAANMARKYIPQLKEHYERVMRNERRRHKVAICAVAIKLTHIIYALLRDNRKFNQEFSIIT